MAFDAGECSGVDMVGDGCGWTRMDSNAGTGDYCVECKKRKKNLLDKWGPARGCPLTRMVVVAVDVQWW